MSAAAKDFPPFIPMLQRQTAFRENPMVTGWDLDGTPMITRSRSGYHLGTIRFTSKDAARTKSESVCEIEIPTCEPEIRGPRPPGQVNGRRSDV